jgi:beta-galactosidase/beta-glucuronidase
MHLIRVVLAICLLVISCATRVYVNSTDRRIYIDGKPFFFKGVNYLPIPIGVNSSTAVDIFNDTRLIDRDIENLKYLGVNAVRIHYLHLTNLDMKMYLFDRLYENGIYVVVSGAVSRRINLSDPIIREGALNDWRQYVLAFKDHPAVIMWSFGNEMNNPSRWNVSVVFNFLRDITRVTHEIEGPDQWRPVSTALMDSSPVQYVQTYDDVVDVWSL